MGNQENIKVHHDRIQEIDRELAALEDKQRENEQASKDASRSGRYGPAEVEFFNLREQYQVRKYELIREREILEHAQVRHEADHGDTGRYQK